MSVNMDKTYTYYESPALEVVELETESCFAVSPGDGDGVGTGSDWPGLGGNGGDGFGTGDDWPDFE